MHHRTALGGVIRVLLVLASLSAWVAVASATGGGSGGGGDVKKGTSNSDASRRDPMNVTGLSEYMEQCALASKKFEERNGSGAIETLRKAIPLAPRNPYGHYLLGEMLLANGSLAEAEGALKKAEQLSDKNQALLRAKILFVLAMSQEEQKKWREAEVTWKAYNEWVFSNSDGGTYPLSAGARTKAIEDALKLDATMEIVRSRIAARQGADAGADGGKP